MPDNLLNKEEWGSLRSLPAFKKYQSYLRMRLSDLQEAWAAGMFPDNFEALRAQAEAENLRHLVNLDYADIDEFYVGTERKKDDDSDTSE